MKLDKNIWRVQMSKSLIIPRDKIGRELRLDSGYYFGLKSEENYCDNGFKKLADFISTPSSPIDPKKEFEGGDFAYIDISSVDNVTGIIRPKLTPVKEAPSRARKVVQRGDVIISSVRPDRNAVALITEDEDGFICSTGFIICRPIKNLITSEYLFALLKSENVYNQLTSKTTATMYPTINQNDINNLLVKISKIEEQEKIAAGILTYIKSLYQNMEKMRDTISYVNSKQI